MVVVVVVVVVVGSSEPLEPFQQVTPGALKRILHRKQLLLRGGDVYNCQDNSRSKSIIK